jgi:hypothetical protein
MHLPRGHGRPLTGLEQRASKRDYATSPTCVHTCVGYLPALRATDMHRLHAISNAAKTLSNTDLLRDRASLRMRRRGGLPAVGSQILAGAVLQFRVAPGIEHEEYTLRWSSKIVVTYRKAVRALYSTRENIMQYRTVKHVSQLCCMVFITQKFIYRLVTPTASTLLRPGTFGRLPTSPCSTHSLP